ncbi:MAG TPA: SLBB domain-containing protein [Chitinispirillaceae bacterium]|nr:SLBB domain-containing protein [Chitinispirillaceae bacterium]
MLIFALFFITGIFSIPQATSLTQKLDTNLINQYKKHNLIPKDINSIDSKKIFNAYDNDSTTAKVLQLSKTDSLYSSNNDSIHPKKLSVYEKLVQGIDINPDSLLPTLKNFGYDIFNNSKPSTFAPSDFVTVPSNYPIGSDDEIIVMLWGRINEEYRLKVDRNGKINIPRIGPVSVAGSSFNTMRENILNRVGKIEGVNASVSMGELRTIGIYIVGEVVSPGYYTLSALSNVTNALFAAGGPTKNGSLRKIQLKRNGKIEANIDFYDFLINGIDNTGLRLQSGDVILVPIIKNMAAITGNVRRSALYEFNDKLNLNQLVKYAGGFTPSAWTNRIQIERFINNDYQVVLDYNSEHNDLPSFEIKDGDIVKIYPVLEKNHNAIYLSGNVKRPGKQEFKENMRISDILFSYDLLLPETYFEYAVILRQDPPDFLERIITFNLKNVLDNSLSTDNLTLKPKDQIVIYNRDFFEPVRTVYIEGAVTYPGEYKLLNNMTIRDLILQAGGLTEEASPIRGEIYRRKYLENKEMLTEKFDFSVELAMKNLSEHNLSLQKLDRVFIRNKKGWEEEKKIKLSGQFVYPGNYILFEGECLGDLIKRAGGLKEDAYLAAAVFTRKSVKELETKHLNEYSKQMEMDLLSYSTEMAAKENSNDLQEALSQQIEMKQKIEKKEKSGRVIIDMRKKENYQNFILEDGDELFVPRKPNTISVIGEVFNPSTFIFEPSNPFVSYYLNAAGGLKKSSDKKQIYIIKANGSILTKKKVLNTNIEPGDAIVVPQKIIYSNPHKRFVDTADAIFKISSIFATLLTLIVTASKL